MSVTPQRVWRFIEADVIPRERELLASSDEHIAGRVRDLQDRARKAGLWALPMPVELGGGGLPLAEYVGTGEIVGRSWFGPFVVGTSNLPAVWMLRRFGSPEVRDHYLPNLAADRCAIELQMGEPDRHPTNPLHVRTVGLSVDGDWIVRGNKASSCAAGESVAAVLCRTENESLLLHRSFSLILVPASAGQQRHGPASGIGEANYRDVRVAKESLVGDRGDGLSVTRLWLRLSGLVDAIHGIGLAERIFDDMCRVLATAPRFGVPVGAVHLLQQYALESYIDIQAVRAQLLSAACRMDADGDVADGQIAQIMTARALRRVVAHAMEIDQATGGAVSRSAEPAFEGHRSVLRQLDSEPESSQRANAAVSVLSGYRSGGSVWLRGLEQMTPSLNAQRGSRHDPGS